MSKAETASRPAPGRGRLDFSMPSIARVYDAATGGKDNLASDRGVLGALREDAPQLPAAARANLEFVSRATEVVAHAGIRQWLNLGCGLPPHGFESTYDIAVRHHGDARVVYVDNDPHVAVHGRALLDVPGAAALIEGDAWDVEAILTSEEAVHLLDRAQPIGIIAAALAHFRADEEDPAGILHRYMTLFPSGYLVFSHARSDLLSPEELNRMISNYKVTADIYPRPLDRIREAFLAGLRVLEPGLVEASTWRSEGLPRDVGRAHFVAAVAAFGTGPVLLAVAS